MSEQSGVLAGPGESQRMDAAVIAVYDGDRRYMMRILTL